MKLKFMSILMCMIIVTSSLVSASEPVTSTTIELSYNSDNASITVSGIGATSFGKGVSVFMIPSGIDINSLSDTNLPLEARLCTTGVDGMYSIVIKLSPSLLSGRYNLYVTSEYGEASDSFMHVNQVQAANAVIAVSTANSANSLKSILSSEGIALGIDMDIFNQNADKISGILFNILSSGKGAVGNTPQAFFSNYNVTLASLLINNGDVDSALKKYASDIHMEYSQYNALSDTVKAILNENLKKIDYIQELLTEVYPEQVILAKIQAADRYSSLKTIVLDSAAFMKLQIAQGSDYNKVKTKDTVFQKMFLKDKSTYDNIVANFYSSVTETLAEERLQSENSDDNSGSPKRSGGGNFSIDTTTLSQLITPIPTPTTSPTEFNDITNHWAYDNIMTLRKKGYVNGDNGKFNPDNNITRSEFAKLVVAAFKLPINSSDKIFTDINNDDWYAPYVNSAYSAGIIQGYGGSFQPNNTISRQDATVILYRLLSKMNKPITGTAEFEDTADISEYATNAVGALASLQVIRGTDNKFHPKNNITRAEMATLLCNLMNYLEKQP